MSLSTTANKVIHAGNGSATSFSYTFPIQASADLDVIYTDADGVETTLTPSQYSVTGIGTPTGGAVTYPLVGSAIASGTLLTILRTVDQTQPTVLSNQGGYFPEVVEAALDRIVMIEQQLDEKIGRAIVTPVTDASPLPIPQDAAARANTALLFDADGNPYAGALISGLAGVSPFILASFLPAADAAAARAVLEITNANLGAVGAVRLQDFPATGTYTPHGNMLFCVMVGVGGGGGGASLASNASTGYFSGGGGGGGFSLKISTAAAIGASKAVTIGAGGTAATAGANNGGAGGDTSVGVLMIAKGGAGGVTIPGAGSYDTGGAGGVVGTGDYSRAGEKGGPCAQFAIASFVGTAGGWGGASAMSGRATTSININAAVVGTAGVANSGGGGASAYCQNSADAAGGAGGSGRVLVFEFCSS